MYQQVIDNATEKMKKTTSVYQTERAPSAPDAPTRSSWTG